MIATGTTCFLSPVIITAYYVPEARVTTWALYVVCKYSCCIGKGAELAAVHISKDRFDHLLIWHPYLYSESAGGGIGQKVHSTAMEGSRGRQVKPCRYGKCGFSSE